MQRAIFSNEAGQGSSAMVHAAAKTDEPVREGVVAGLEPFIDTIVVCTFTALIILSTGIWNRTADIPFDEMPTFTANDAQWTLEDTPVSEDGWFVGEGAFIIVSADENADTANNLHKVTGTVTALDTGPAIVWAPIESQTQPVAQGDGYYRNYVGATLTANAFDSVTPGLGKWVVTVATWLFGISTMIAWCYYGEQGVVFMAGERAAIYYKLFYCLLIIVATLGLVKSENDLNNVISIGTGVIMFANIPIIWMFGYQAMRAYKDYIARLTSGRMGPDHPPPSLDDLLSGRDVEKG